MSTSIMSYPSHGIAVLSLGLPLIGGHLGQVAIGVTDTVMLGWYGVDELAAQTVARVLLFGVVSSWCGVCLGSDAYGCFL